jgi:hypothetical protein
MADVVATPFSSKDDAPLATKNSGTYATMDMAEALFGSNNVPRIEDIDRQYNAGRTSAACVSAWSRMRREKVNPVGIKVPLETLEAKAQAAGISLKKLHKALGVYLANQDKIPDQEYISIVDFDKSGSQPRWFFISLRDGSVSSYRVSAGKGSDPDHDGFATRFSNAPGSGASSLGCAIGAGKYDGKHRNSMYLHGLEATNNNMCNRSVVVHTTGGAYAAGLGRSNGCLAVDSTSSIYEKLGKGGLICSYRDGETTSAAKAPHRQHVAKDSRHHVVRRHRHIASYNHRRYHHARHVRYHRRHHVQYYY